MPDKVTSERIIEGKVIRKIRERGDAGQQKYGMTLDRHDLSMAEWMQHFQEELLDACQYAEVNLGKMDVVRQSVQIAMDALLEIQKSSQRGYWRPKSLQSALDSLALALDAIDGKKETVLEHIDKAEQRILKTVQERNQ